MRHLRYIFKVCFKTMKSRPMREFRTNSRMSKVLFIFYAFSVQYKICIQTWSQEVENIFVCQDTTVWYNVKLPNYALKLKRLLQNRTPHQKPIIMMPKENPREYFIEKRGIARGRFPLSPDSKRQNATRKVVEHCILRVILQNQTIS